MLTENTIRQLAAGPAYSKGCDYYLSGNVKTLHRRDSGTFEAEVRGGELYYVELKLDAAGQVLHDFCDCPAFAKFDGACKHIVAVLKLIQRDWWNYYPPQANREVQIARHLPSVPLITTEDRSNISVQQLLAHFRVRPAPSLRLKEKQAVRLEPTLFHVQDNPRDAGANWLEFSLGNDRLYVVKNIPEFLRDWQADTEIVLGKQCSLRRSQSELDPVSLHLFHMLQLAYDEEQERAGWSYSGVGASVFETGRRFRLTRASLAEFLQLYQNQSILASIQYRPTEPTQVRLGRPPVRFAIDGDPGGFRLRYADPSEQLFGLDADWRHVYHQGVIYQVDAEFSRAVAPMSQVFRDGRQGEILLPPASVSDFASDVLPALEAVGEVVLAETVRDKLYREPLAAVVFLDRYELGVSARVEFRYGDIVINPALSASSKNVDETGRYLVRDSQAEVRLLQIFLDHRFMPQGETLLQPDEEATYDFIQEGLPELLDQFEVYLSDEFAALHSNRKLRVRAAVRLNDDFDWLELTLDCGGLQPEELQELLAAYRLKKRYHRLRDGRFLGLDQPEFAAAAQLVEQLGLAAADLKQAVIRLPKYRALTLDNLARMNETLVVERSGAVRRMLQELREPQDSEDELPAEIHATLRDYQKTGFKWLKALARHGMGGVLADDMGLGKTLQVLAYLMSVRQEGRPSLVVAPTSLVYNWQEEAARFTPVLRTLVVTGQQGERQAALADLEAVDLVITSYGLLKRDIELYEQLQWKTCFLDEAQNIKNPQTLNAQAVKRIRAGCSFALTGTPIENSLTELWSIFDYVMPGYLRHHASFVKRFEAPVAKDPNSPVLRELSRHIRPFLLRRMKHTVLQELPEKIESRLSAPMTAEQTRLYTAWLMSARQEFEQEIETKGFDQSRIKILAILTRLRQLCCHPALFVENYSGGSGKMELIADVVRDAVAAGHRLLIFSQFTGMLDLIKPVLDELDVSWHYLDGGTSAQDRIQRVNAFNRGERDAFLISLKAGGAGLNLTGADMVIHCDPWWNPAVEDQATDRAYRIGQKNVVQVFKLVAKGTIEEKILALQERKRELVDSLIQPGESFIGKMTEAEIRGLFGE